MSERTRLMIDIAIVEDDNREANILKAYIKKYGSETAQSFQITLYDDALNC